MWMWHSFILLSGKCCTNTSRTGWVGRWVIVLIDELPKVVPHGYWGSCSGPGWWRWPHKGWLFGEGWHPVYLQGLAKPRTLKLCDMAAHGQAGNMMRCLCGPFRTWSLLLAYHCTYDKGWQNKERTLTALLSLIVVAIAVHIWCTHNFLVFLTTSLQPWSKIQVMENSIGNSKMFWHLPP